MPVSQAELDAVSTPSTSQTLPVAGGDPGGDGSTTIHFSPEQPDGVDPGNWIQTVPGKGWFPILRCSAQRRRSSTRAGGRGESNRSSRERG